MLRKLIECDLILPAAETVRERLREWLVQSFAGRIGKRSARQVVREAVVCYDYASQSAEILKLSRHGQDEEHEAMKFIEMTGKRLKLVIADDETHLHDLDAIGIHDDTVVRVNQQGDIEVRRPDRWDVVGGLLGNYEQRMRKQLGLEWV